MHHVFWRPRAWAMTALFVCSNYIDAANADSTAPVLAVNGGVEYFHLKEIDSNGARLLAETGDRLVLSAMLDNRNRYDPRTSFLYHLEGAAYAARVDYDGQSQSLDTSQNNQPFSSKTDYQGARVEALLGYRLRALPLPRPLEILGGVGADSWNRRIQTGTTANGTLVSGIEEIYRVIYGKLALGMTDLWSGGWHDHLQGGVKLPIKVSEEVNLRAIGYDQNLNLSPANAYSGFVKLTLEAPPRTGHAGGNLLLSLYYEELRFNPSPSQVVSRGSALVSVWQPETHIDVVGMQVGYRF